MKTTVKIALSVIMILASCDEPETVVTNYVHPDGSVTRKIEMRSTKRKFETSKILVPFDNTWTIKDSIVIGDKNDTTWIKRAEKQFRNINEINLAYKNDSGPNRIFAKRADFSKSFKWFHTEYRFSETFDKRLSFGYPVKDFLNNEELLYFYSPDGLTHSKENGPDSLKYRTFADSVKKKTDLWTARNIVSGWIDEFSALASTKGDSALSKKSLKSREGEFVNLFTLNEEKFDSLWKNGFLLKEAIGEGNAVKYDVEADSAMERVIRQYLVDFRNYSVRIVMPGKLIGTNGFIDSSQILLWPVKADYFLTQEYRMWAESKVPNRWAWIVSIVFVLFVLAGVVIRIIKK